MEHKAYLWALFVLPALRKQGVARALIKEALAFASGLPGVQQVTLSVNAANRAAVSPYESCGFTPFGLEPRAAFIEGQYQNDIHMVWFCDLAQSESEAPPPAQATRGR
jgi:ribosomal protein S18 acetylase RimI-like enzyme